MSSGVKVFVCLPARICSCFQLALLYAPVLVLQTFALSVGLGVFSSFCPAWSLCSHCCSISDMTGTDSESCLQGPTWQREPGTHPFHSLLLQVQCHGKSTGTPWSINSAGLRTVWFLTMEKKKEKCWLCKRQHWWDPKKALAGHEGGRNQTVMSSHLMSLNKRHISMRHGVHEIASRFHGSHPSSCRGCLVPGCPWLTGLTEVT